MQETPYDIFVMLTAKIVHQESQKENFKLSEIYIVTNDNKVAIRLAGLFDKEDAFSPLTSFSRTRRNITAEKKVLLKNILFVCLIVFKATFNNISTYIVAVSFIGGGNLRTRRKPLTCRKSLPILSHNVVLSIPCPDRD